MVMDAKDITFLPVKKWEQRASNIFLTLFIIGMIAYSMVYVLGPNTLFWYGSGLRQMDLETLTNIPFNCGFAGLMTLFGLVIHRIGRSHVGWMSIAIGAWLFATFLMIMLCSNIIVALTFSSSVSNEFDADIMNICHGVYFTCVTLSFLCYVYIISRSLLLSKGHLKILFVKQLAAFCAFLILIQFCLPGAANNNVPLMLEIILCLCYLSVVLYIGVLWRNILDAAHLHAPSTDNYIKGQWLLKDEEELFIDEIDE